MSALFNRVCISFVQRATCRYTIWKYVSWYLLYVIFFFCVYSVCYIRSVTIHFPYLAQIIYVSLAYAYSEYMCVFIHLSVHVTVLVWILSGQQFCWPWLMYFVLVGSPVLRTRAAVWRWLGHSMAAWKTICRQIWTVLSCWALRRDCIQI